MIILYILLLHIHVSVRQYICMFENWYSPKMIKVAPVLGQMRLESIGFRVLKYAVFWANPKLVETLLLSCSFATFGMCKAVSKQRFNMSMCRLLSLVPHIQPYSTI